MVLTRKSIPSNVCNAAGFVRSGCKWFRTGAIRDVLNEATNDGWFFDTEIMIAAERAGLTIAQVPVLFRRRFDKASTVRPLADAIDYWRHLIAFRRRLAKQPRVLRERRSTDDS